MRVAHFGACVCYVGHGALSALLSQLYFVGQRRPCVSDGAGIFLADSTAARYVASGAAAFKTGQTR